jgi:hypothetical protein
MKVPVSYSAECPSVRVGLKGHWVPKHLSRKIWKGGCCVLPSFPGIISWFVTLWDAEQSLG